MALQKHCFILYKNSHIVYSFTLHRFRSISFNGEIHAFRDWNWRFPHDDSVKKDLLDILIDLS